MTYRSSPAENSTPEVFLTIACECYTDTDFVRGAMAGLPTFGGQLEWCVPFTPDSATVTQADLVLMVADRQTLLKAIGRSVTYRNLGVEHLLLYVQDEDDVDLPNSAIPALSLTRSQFAEGLFKLTETLLEPVFAEHGINWEDTRNLLTMAHRTVLEHASSDDPERAIRAAFNQLYARVSGRAVQGIQVGIFSNGKKLKIRSQLYLNEVCKCFKNAAGYETYSAPAALVVEDWLDDNHYEVRLFSRVECLLVARHSSVDAVPDRSEQGGTL